MTSPTNLELIHSTLRDLNESSREQSEKVGAAAANLRNLGRNFDRHCDDDDKRHSENIQTLAQIEDALRDQGNSLRTALDAQGVRFEKAMATQSAAFQTFADAITPMMPAMRRLRARERRWMLLVRCVSRWKTFIVAAGLTIGAVYTWVEGHWPRIAAGIRWLARIVGPG